MPKTDVLPLLADGAYHSGQDIADALGVSRTAVWKQLKQLEGIGLRVESSKARGYRIPGGIDLLDPAQILEQLPPGVHSLLSDLQIDIQMDSTNAEAMRQLQAGSSSALVCMAEQQTAGRGRRGREWVSPFGSNLYLSITWEFQGGAAALEGLSLAVGVAVAEALEAAGAPAVSLKWPNDLLIDGSKLGGILIEMVGDAAGACQVVIGVGLNVRMPASAGEAIDQSWTDLAQRAVTLPKRNDLSALVISELVAMLAGFEKDGFGPWMQRWLDRDSHAGSAVNVHSGSHHWSGVARGVDRQGALQLETSEGVMSIYGGEVSVRLKQ